LIAGKTYESRRNRFPHGGAIRLPVARTIHLIQRDKPTPAVANRDADAGTELSGSADGCVNDLLRL